MSLYGIVNASDRLATVPPTGLAMSHNDLFKPRRSGLEKLPSVHCPAHASALPTARSGRYSRRVFTRYWLARRW